MRSYSIALNPIYIATSDLQAIDIVNKSKKARALLYVCTHRKNSTISICLLAFDKLPVAPLRARELKPVLVGCATAFVLLHDAIYFVGVNTVALDVLKLLCVVLITR